MSGSNWPGSNGTDAQAMFDQGNNENVFRSTSYLGQGGGAGGSTMAPPPPGMTGDGGMPSLYRRPTHEEISAVLSQYAPGPSNNGGNEGGGNGGTGNHNDGTNGQPRPPMFAHPSQMSMQSQASGGIPMGQNNGSGMADDVAQRAASNGQFAANQGMSLDPAAAAAAAAAYGHLGYGNAGPAAGPDPRRQPSTGAEQKDPTGGQGGAGGQLHGMASGPEMGMMQGFNPTAPNQMPMAGGFLPAYPVQGGNAFDGAGSGIGHGGAGDPIANDDFGPGKKRRMTFGGQFQPGGSPPKPAMMQHDSSASMMHDYSSIKSTPVGRAPGPDVPQHLLHHLPTRPPLLHRRSRSGSELAGNMPGFRGGMSYDGFSDIHSFHGPGGPGQAAPVFLSSHSHQASFTRGGPLPPSALGGHAASHPPGLGSQILRGVDVSASGSSAASDFTKRKGWTGRVVEELLDFVHVLDPDGVILFASPSAYSLTGWTSEELRGRKLIEFIHPQDVPSVEREIDRMRQSNGELLTYYRFKTKPKSFSAPGSGDKGDSAEGASSGAGDDEKDRDKGDQEYAEALTRDGEYVVFEASGHPYYPPKPLVMPANGAQEGDEADGADAQKEAGAAEGSSGEANPNAGAAAAAGDLKSESMTHSASGSKQSSNSQSQSLDTPSEASSLSRGALQCFFCSSRPYPSKNTSMLDSFLELKLENEKLRLLIADMDLTGPDNDAERANFTAAYHPDLLKQELEGEGGPFRDGVNPMFGTAFLQQGQPGQQPGAQQQQQDPRFPQSGAFGPGTAGGATRHNSLGSHPTSPTMRSGPAEDLLANVVGTGNDSDDEATSPTTASGAAPSGSQGLIDEARRKKKPKQDDGDHVCTDCGRVDSPEWRKGPLGPKTLCNACGLRWAKKIKRKGGDPTMAGMLVQPPGAPQQLLGHGHPLQHSFGRAPDGSIPPGMAMGPPGSINVAGMGVGQPGMMPTSPIFATRPSFDEGSGHGHGHGHGQGP
ncbi:uncharacterized protein PFL1_03839 [Pseudozyma flocculosa PF-1]|uniref:Related to zinc finger protein white collar 2 (Wc-2) n=2 Tax=Pseudozyma flocculosa TaxID=84751 RepID=A0A5C3EZ72_9BASI|nr:uncharacterized protein PFL1_03839 [Pseudozyma flocculosa PF-1]EPQ28535.1 hypothetical protein PFL1_03839 [Pseudozyma flocculosa PF-1]SPO36459.1 related to zinc finger protein white collar 2 (wc-2) [Pseudozyma flocculosa]